MSSSDPGDTTPQQPQPPGAGPYGQQPYGQPYGQQPYGYSQPSEGQPPYGAPYGQPPYGAPAYTPAPPNESLALPAMVIGIVALVLMCGYGVGLLGSPVALVMGRVSMKRIDASGGRLGGRGFAQAGFVLGLVGTILLVLAIIAVVVIVAVAVNGGFQEEFATTPSHA